MKLQSQQKSNLFAALQWAGNTWETGVFTRTVLLVGLMKTGILRKSEASVNIKTFSQMEDMLEEWGRWVSTDAIQCRKLYYPPSDNLQKFRKRRYEFMPPNISDDAAYEICLSMNQMRLVSKNLCKVADCNFRLKMSYTDIAEHCDLAHRQEVRKVLDTAVTWVWGYLTHADELPDIAEA